MIYLKLFEDFNQTEFPDLFGNHLLRGVNTEQTEYIDDPSKRSVSIGISRDESYRKFLENYTNLGLQDPTKSVHFYLNPSQKEIEMMNYYGKTFKVLPEKNAQFSFCKELRNGGLGSTWFFVSRCLFDWLKLDPELDNSKKLNTNPEFFKYFKHQSELKDLLELEWLYDEDRKKFQKLITGYQQWLIDEGVVGNITYQELLELKDKDLTLQIWTQSPVLHQRYQFEKAPKEPKLYKSKPLLNKTDFENLGIKSDEISKIYKSDIGKKIKEIQDRLTDDPNNYEHLRKKALELIKKANL